MAATNYDMIKDLPGYKFILKAVLKTQIQLLVEQLATHTDEESVILTASVADGTLSHLGSDSGKSFLNDNEELRASFMRHCMEKHESGSEYYEPDFTEVVSHNGKTAEKPLGRFRHEPYPTSRIIKRRGSSASISSNGSQLSGFCNYGNKPLSHSLPENYNTESQLENFNPPDEMKSETFLTHCDYPYPKPETSIVKQTDTSVVKDEGDDGLLSGRRSIGAVSAASPFEPVDLRSNQSVGHGSEMPNMDFCEDELAEGEQEDIVDDVPDLDEQRSDPAGPERGLTGYTENYKIQEDSNTPPVLEPEEHIEGVNEIVPDNCDDGGSENIENRDVVVQGKNDKSESEQDSDRKRIVTRKKENEGSSCAGNKTESSSNISDRELDSSDERDRCPDEFGPCERPREFHEKIQAISCGITEMSTTESETDLAESERLEETMTEDDDAEIGDESQQHKRDRSENREPESDNAKTEDSEGMTDIELELDNINKELGKENSAVSLGGKNKNMTGIVSSVKECSSDGKDAECSSGSLDNPENVDNPIAEALKLLTGWQKSKEQSIALSKEMLYVLLKEKIKSEGSENTVSMVADKLEGISKLVHTEVGAESSGIKCETQTSGLKTENVRSFGNKTEPGDDLSNDREKKYKIEKKETVESSGLGRRRNPSTASDSDAINKDFTSSGGNDNNEVNIRGDSQACDEDAVCKKSELSNDKDVSEKNRGKSAKIVKDRSKTTENDRDRGKSVESKTNKGDCVESENNNDNSVESDKSRGKSVENDKRMVIAKSMLSENKESYQAMLREVQEECNDDNDDDCDNLVHDDVDGDKSATRQRRNSGVQTEFTQTDIETRKTKANTENMGASEKVSDNKSKPTVYASETKECSTDTGDMNANNLLAETGSETSQGTSQITRTVAVSDRQDGSANNKQTKDNSSESGRLNPESVKQSDKKVPSPIVIDLDENDSIKVQKTPVKQVTGKSGQQKSSGQKQQTPSSQTKRRLSTPERGGKHKSGNKGSFIDNLISKGIPIIIPDDEEDEPVTPQKGWPSQKSRSAIYPNAEAMQSPYHQQKQLTPTHHRPSSGNSKQFVKTTQQTRMQQALAYYDQQVVNDYYESQGMNEDYDDYPMPQGYMPSPSQMSSPSHKAPPMASSRQLFTPPKAVNPNISSRQTVSPSHTTSVSSQSPSQTQRSMMEQIRSRSLAQHQESLNISGQSLNRAVRSGSPQSRLLGRNTAGLTLSMPSRGQSPSGGKSQQTHPSPGSSSQDLAAMQQDYTLKRTPKNSQESIGRPVLSPARQQLSKRLNSAPATPQSQKSNIKSGMMIVIDDEPSQKAVQQNQGNHSAKQVSTVPKSATVPASVALNNDVTISSSSTAVATLGQNVNMVQNQAFVQTTNTMPTQNLVQGQPLMQNSTYVQAPNMVQTSSGIVQNAGILQNPSLLQSSNFVQNPMLIQNTGLVQGQSFLQNTGLPVVQNQRLVSLQQPTLSQVPVSTTLTSPMHSPEVLPVISNVTSMSKDYGDSQRDMGVLQLRMPNQCVQQVPVSVSCVQDPNMGAQTYQTFVIQAQQVIPGNPTPAVPERQNIEVSGVKRAQSEEFQEATVKTEPEAKRSKNNDSEIPTGYTPMDTDNSVQTAPAVTTSQTVVVKTEADSPSKQSPGLELDIDLPGVPVLSMPSSEITKLRQQSLESKNIKEEVMEKNSTRKKTARKSSGTCSSSNYFDDASSTSSEKSMSDKKFGCGDCGKAFDTKQGLSMHFKIHTKSKPVECDVCGKHYSKMGLLKKHIRTHFEDP